MSNYHNNFTINHISTTLLKLTYNHMATTTCNKPIKNIDEWVVIFLLVCLLMIIGSLKNCSDRQSDIQNSELTTN